MKDREKFHEALVCGHCGAKNRMSVIGTITDTETEELEPDEDYSPAEFGTRYDLQLCPVCNKVVLVSGPWHDGMESVEDLEPKVILPEANDRRARQLFESVKLDLRCMQLAVAEAQKCSTEEKAKGPKPKVGAAVAFNGGQKVVVAHRGELAPGDHAEFTLLEGKCKNEKLTGATVYTTLEPCTERSPDKNSLCEPSH